MNSPTRPGPVPNRFLALGRVGCFACALALAGCSTLHGPASTSATEPPAVVAQAPQPDPAPAVSSAGSPSAPAVAAEPAARAEALAAPAPTTPQPLQPRSRLDPQQDATRGDLWQRVREGFAIDDLDGELVTRWEQFYARQPEYVQRMAERGSRYLFHIVEEVERRGMPAELALLPFIESAFNPQAMSRAKASGMWQFMPATGREFELRQNLFRDDRRDVLASTRAALDYLQQLHRMFGDWPLALAAYNWGQGNVLRAQRNNQRAGKPTDYHSLRMPAETRNYVPKLQAMKNIVAGPERFKLSLPPLENHPYFLSVPIERDIDVSIAAAMAGLSLDEFRWLNPQLNKPVILAAGTPQVLLPYDNANRFVAELARATPTTPLASWTAWVAPRTLKPADAAKAVGMSEAELRDVNRIPARMLVKVGSTLLVPRSERHADDVALHIADNAMMSLAPESRPLRRVRVKAASKGETLASLARRHRVAASDVARWNGVSSTARFKPGQLVVLMLPPKAPSRVAKSSRTAAKVAAKSPSKKRVAAKPVKKAPAVATRPQHQAQRGAGQAPRAATAAVSRATQQ